jgi:hypothetical protein
MIRACLVSGRIAVFADEGASRVRDLDLLVDREMGRAAALGAVAERVLRKGDRFDPPGMS